jgi:hypothetical protein
MVYGIWYMVYGTWYMVHGIWYMVHGIWYIVYGISRAQKTTQKYPFFVTVSHFDTVAFRQSSLQCN